MDQRPTPDPDERSLELPHAFVRELRRLGGEGPAIPAAVDERILRAARAQLPGRPRESRPPESRPWGWRIALPAAAAAAVLLAALLLPHALRSLRSDPADVDGNGRLDIVDAYVLALRVESGASLDPRLDFSGEGTVDRRDVEHLATLAVRLR